MNLAASPHDTLTEWELDFSVRKLDLANEVPVTPAKHFVVMVNPRGGRQRGLAVLESVKPIFDATGAVLDIRVSAHAGHLLEIAKTIDLEAYDAICVVGGDGTIHETINGLMQQEHLPSTPVGFIPAGTGNTVLQHLGCVEPLEAARRIVVGNVQRLDVIQVRMEDEVAYSVNIVGWGGIVEINRTAERLRRLGPPRYAAAALIHVLRSKRHQAKLVFEETTHEGEFAFVIACNTKFTGKGMLLAPRADMNDGKLDLVVVRRTSRWKLLRLFNKIFDGSHLSEACVEYHQVRSFSIETESHECLNLDGELKGSTPMSAAVVPGALRIFV